MSTIATRLAVACLFLASIATAHAADPAQAASGVKEALAQGVSTAITKLGKPDGFLKDQAVRIALPGKLSKVADTARKLGQGKYVDQLETTMNRAAEAAVPAAAEIFSDAIRAMSMKDAMAIVTGGEHAATDYFRKSSGDALRTRLLPIVKTSTDAAGATKAYKKLMEKGGGMLGKLGGDAQDAVDLDSYVTDKALDGVYHYIGEQEANIRKNPVATGSALLQTVFGKR